MTRLTIVTVTKDNVLGLVKTAKSIPINSDLIEWLVIDGASTDNTKEYVSSLNHRGLKFISDPDEGIFDAMNKGLKLATGELIIFLNAGDSFVSEVVPSKIIANYEMNQWTWAVGGAITVNETGDTLWKWPKISPKSLKLKLAVNSYCHQSTVYQREPLVQLNGYVADSYHSDWITSLQFLKICDPFLIEEDWVYFLAGGVSSTRGLNYWFSESIRLRRITNTTILGSSVIDYSLQKLLKIYFKTSRGQLLRPDLHEK